MVTFAATFWSGSVEHLTEAFTSYVGCELIGLGELCSKTVLLCYAPMLSNALIMLLRIVIMLTLCWLIILFISKWYD